MAKQDYYQTLGVAKDASAEAIKKAYRTAAMKFHPDRNAGDKAAEHKFKEISEAYEILKDEQKRAAYDRYGHAAFENGAGPRAGGGAGFGAGGFADIFEEMFGEFVGGRGRGPQATSRGGDLRYNMQITLEEAFTGKTATVRVPSSVKCEDCSGSGGEKGAHPISCPVCHGSGRTRMTQGFFTMERTCTHCAGTGRVIEKPCKTCGGSGRTRRDKNLNVNVPPGVEDGTRIRLAGEGEAGLRGSPPGDLYIFLSIEPHKLFERDSADLHCKVPISMVTATLGGPIEVPGIDGTRVRLQIPAGAQTGQQFRLKGKGMSVLRQNHRGDFYVHLAVETPVHLSKKQQELLREFDKSATKGKPYSPEAEGFFAKVKEFWQELKE